VRIVWHSNAPFASSGYGVQTALFAPRLKKLGHEIAISCFWGLVGGRLDWNGIPLYPGGVTPFGVDVAAGHCRDFNADLLLTLIDAWVMEPERWPGIPWASWTPIDHYPVPPPIAQKLGQCQHPIAMSRFGFDAMRDMGAGHALYVPHGFDPEVYHRDEKAGEEVRKWMGVPDGAPLLGMVAANKGGWPSRKSIGQVLEAFAKIVRDGSDAHLYLHTHLDAAFGGVNVMNTVGVLGIGDRVHGADQYRNLTGQVGSPWMRGIYNALDALVNPSMGEGFGIPVLEAQACGTPVITGAWTAMRELTWAGWSLDPDSEAMAVLTPQDAYMWMPNVSALAEAMLSACTVRKPKDLSDAAVTGARVYEADHVTQTYWKPALDAIADSWVKPDRSVRIARVRDYAPKTEEATA
jgi:glycosyltransferase involved in cell wall biosynthesis